MVNVTAELINDRIAVKSERRFPGDLQMSKAVPGHRWSKECGYWHYPLTLATCRSLREVYTDMLFVGPILSRWAKNEIAKTEWMRDFSKQQDADLTRIPEVAPRLHAAMASRTYQRVGARFIAMNRNVLLADEPTLGKTIQYLGGLIEAGVENGQHLVVAPKSSLRSVWADEIFKWTDFHPFWMPEGRAKRERMLEMFLDDDSPSKFLIVNPEMLQIRIEQWCNKCEVWILKDTKDTDLPIQHWTDAHNTSPKIMKCEWPGLFDITWNSVCVDEAHKSLLGIRSTTKKTQAGEGLSRLRTVEGGVRLASTGTPLKGKAINFWSTFYWLLPGTYGSKWAWAEQFLDITDNGFGKVIGDIRPEREEALHESLRTVMLRRTKREVQPDLPEDLTLDHWVTMTERHRKQYMDILEEGEAEILGGSITTKGILDEYTRQKQFSFGVWSFVAGGGMTPASGQSAKMDLLLNMLERRGVTGDPKTEFKGDTGAHKFIVASQFTRILDFVERELASSGIATLKITGSVSGKKRDEAVSSFQQDPDGPRVLLVNTLAGGTALTLDAMCDEMFILDETWTRDDQFQLEGRIRNRDVEKRVAVRTYHYIRTRDTIEEEIANSGLTQDEFQKTLLDRSRGLKIKKREIQK